MSYRNKSVFVTGAGGFIGSHLVEALVRDGAHVRALIRYTSHGDIGNLRYLPQEVFEQIQIVRGDVRDAGQMRKFMQFNKLGADCDYVFHLAALIGIPYSYEAPESYIDTNLHGTMNILEAARSLDVGRIVITSTSEVYGTAQYVPIDERHPLQAQSPYAASKIAADKLAESYHLAFGVRVTTVRPFNTYGPRQSTRAIVPTIATQMLLGTNVLKLGSLTPKRDMLFVEDTVKGFMMIGETAEWIGKVTNLGTGRSVPMSCIVDELAKITGFAGRIETDQSRIRPDASEVQCLLANATEAQNLGWEPKISLEEGLAKTVEFIRTNPPQRNEYAI